MSLRMEEAQRHTDQQRDLADQREALHRFAPLPPELPANPNLILIPPKLGLTTDDWDGWVARREQIERDEKAEFNKRYGYKS